jgi:hypothetical protein
VGIHHIDTAAQQRKHRDSQEAAEASQKHCTNAPTRRLLCVGVATALKKPAHAGSAAYAKTLVALRSLLLENFKQR